MAGDAQQHEPLGPGAYLGEVLQELAKVIDARAGSDPQTSWTAKLLAGGPQVAAQKLGEEAVETVIAVSAQGDADVASESADLLYHLLVALRSRGVSLDAVAKALESRQGKSGLAEKASRPAT